MQTSPAPHFAAPFRSLEGGEEELVPGAVVGRLLAGESPVRVWRELRGLTQPGDGRASGVHRVVVADIEARRRGGSVRISKRLAEALEVTVDDWLLAARHANLA